MVERWQEHRECVPIVFRAVSHNAFPEVPALRPEKERDWSHSALAVCICGFIAVDKYSLLPTRLVVFLDMESCFSQGGRLQYADRYRQIHRGVLARRDLAAPLARN